MAGIIGEIVDARGVLFDIVELFQGAFVHGQVEVGFDFRILSIRYQKIQRRAAVDIMVTPMLRAELTAADGLGWQRVHRLGSLESRLIIITVILLRRSRRPSLWFEVPDV